MDSDENEPGPKNIDLKIILKLTGNRTTICYIYISKVSL
jgi:hypothetical protein